MATNENKRQKRFDTGPTDANGNVPESEKSGEEKQTNR